jgi:importin subunit beta-1
MFDYVISLREGIMDAWGGIIGAMKASNKSQHSVPPVSDRLLTQPKLHS